MIPTKLKKVHQKNQLLHLHINTCSNPKKGKVYQMYFYTQIFFHFIGIRLYILCRIFDTTFLH